MRRRIVSFASLFLSAALLISSCCGCAKKKENDSDLDEEIVEVIKNYGKAVKKLSIDKILDYASDSDFETLDLDSEESEIISALLKRAKIEVTETTIKKKNTASATVEITYVDLESVLNNFDGQADKESIIDAINDEKPGKETVKVSLENDEDVWIITDDSSIYELLLNGESDLGYYLHPLEPTETEIHTPPTTEEPTTEDPATTEEPTSTEDPTSEESSQESATPTPDNTSASDPKPTHETLSTQPSPGQVDGHMKSPSEIDKLFKENGFDADTYSEDGQKITFYSCEEDDIFLYVIEFDSKDTADAYAPDIIDEMVYEIMAMQDGTVTDKWQGNTHNIYSTHRKDDNHNYDLYIYQKDDLLVIGGLDEYPDADICVDYLIWFEEIGLWKF